MYASALLHDHAARHRQPVNFAVVGERPDSVERPAVAAGRGRGGGGAIVEDLQLGLDLTGRGCAPLSCPSAVVSSTFPHSAGGAKAQRQRWEHGHIGLILTRALPLAIQGLRADRRSSLALGLDLLVPPLSLLIILLTITAFASSFLMVGGGSDTAFLISVSALALVTLSTCIAWLRYGRETLPLRAIGLIPLYIFAKLKLYVAALLGRKVSQWVRADRG